MKQKINKAIVLLRERKYRSLYEKIKNYPRRAIEAKNMVEANSMVPDNNTSSKNITARDGSSKTNYFDYVFKQNNNKDNKVGYKEHKKIETDIRAIAFYLPQFHPVAENDEWWGKGFTEWTNVSKAIPQFEGHYQPHLPGELGFYDLRLPEIQKRQVELAKNYGISGFCFHFYWFNGRRLLEKPLDSYVADKSLDLPFCINWANENWTRRWDGKDQDILLGQNYCDEDDIDFIKEAATLFEDERYIRINGKPLLIIYRPSAFPDIKATAQRWREWCINDGIGEIYLVLTHSFEHINPEHIGFDAAVEFAPNSFPLEKINDKVNFYNNKHEGTVYNYTSAIKHSKSYPTPKYKKFRSLCPGWDNEARKPGKGITLHGATPNEYAIWLRYLCNFTDSTFEGEEKLIFVNAWNEWAEGAHLEPDQKFGYGYLEQTHNVLTTYNKPLEFDTIESIEKKQAKHRTAIVVHLYHVDVWEHLKKHFSNIKEGYDLYINVNNNITEDELFQIRLEFPSAIIVSLENRGRDILPFLNIYKAIEDKGYSYICKLHSKKSLHRTDGDAWRDHLVESLIGSQRRVEKAYSILDSSDNGIVIARGNRLSYKLWIGSNETKITKFAKDAGILLSDDFLFPAGSMFWFKPEALKLLTEYAKPDDFEDESGQIDGTMAHAVERLFGLVCQHNRCKIVEI